MAKELTLKKVYENGFSLDVKSLASDIFKMMPEEQKLILRCDMVSMDLISIFMKKVGEEMTRQIHENSSSSVSEDVNIIKQYSKLGNVLDKKILIEIEDDFCKELLIIGKVS